MLLRRQLLRTLSFAFGSSFILSRNQLGMATQTTTQPKVSPPPAGVAVRDEIAGGTEMEKVTGIGGFFFRAKDPKALGRWYQQHLGISLTPSSYEDSVWQQDAGPTVFDPQPDTSDLFKGTDKVWMLNFRVRDLLRENRSNCGNLQSHPPKFSGQHQHHISDSFQHLHTKSQTSQRI